MSALGQERTFLRTSDDVRFTPEKRTLVERVGINQVVPSLRSSVYGCLPLLIVQPDYLSVRPNQS